MMKRDTNNSRTNLEVNSSVISNKSRTNTQTGNTVSNQQKPPVAQSQFATTLPQPMAQTQIYTQQQQVNISTGSNFLSQNTVSVVSSRTNPQTDPFTSYQNSSVLNARAMTNQVR